MHRVDVSMPLAIGMPAFPGDPPFVSTLVRSRAAGDPYELSRLELGTHTGTHLDPPSHFVPGGPSVDRVDVDRLNGPATVLDLRDAPPAIGPAELRAVRPGTERLLLRTANSARWAERLAFFPDYAALAPDGATFLRERGVRLVGIDALSIERDESGTFPVHHELLGHDVLVLEGLLMAEAPPGGTVLRCLPLRIQDGNGGPARAVLEYA